MHAAQQIKHAYGQYPSRKADTIKQSLPRKQQTRAQNSYVRETCALFLCVLAFLGLNLFLLSRYAEITAVKHQVLGMSKTLEQLQNQKEQLSVEIEKSSKLEWIESQAVERLAMRYPDKSQVIYISVDPNRVALIDGALDMRQIDERYDGLLPHSIERIFHKFAGILQI